MSRLKKIGGLGAILTIGATVPRHVWRWWKKKSEQKKIVANVNDVFHAILYCYAKIFAGYNFDLQKLCARVDNICLKHFGKRPDSESKPSTKGEIESYQVNDLAEVTLELYTATDQGNESKPNFTLEICELITDMRPEHCFNNQELYRRLRKHVFPVFGANVGVITEIMESLELKEELI